MERNVVYPYVDVIIFPSKPTNSVLVVVVIDGMSTPTRTVLLDDIGMSDVSISYGRRRIYTRPSFLFVM